MPAHLYSVPQTPSHVFSWTQQHSMVWGLQKYISFSKYSRPDQPQLSLQTPLRSHFSSQLQALNKSFSTCDCLSQGSNLEAELGKHKIYATWKKMKFCFSEGCWPFFTRQAIWFQSFPGSVTGQAVNQCKLLKVSGDTLLCNEMTDMETRKSPLVDFTSKCLWCTWYVQDPCTRSAHTHLMFLYKSYAQIYILEAPLIRGRPLQCSSKTQRPLLHQCCAPAFSLAGQKQGKHPSNKDNHCCDPFEFIASVWLRGWDAAQDGWGGWSQSFLPESVRGLVEDRLTHMWAADKSQNLLCRWGVCTHLMCGACERTVTCNMPNPITKGERPDHSPALLSTHSMGVLDADTALCWGWGLGSLLTCPLLWHQSLKHCRGNS